MDARYPGEDTGYLEKLLYAKEAEKNWWQEEESEEEEEEGEEREEGEEGEE